MFLPEFLKISKNAYLNQYPILSIYFFSSSTFPDILKQTKLIPIFKKGDQPNCNNYRPISPPSNISKIIEKIIHKQLYCFLEINCLYTHQYKFKNQHSTNHALITQGFFQAFIAITVFSFELSFHVKLRKLSEFKPSESLSLA